MDSVEDRDAIVRVLADHDLACPSCAYNLRGLTGMHCPECNQRLALRVGLAEPRQAAFVTGLVGIAAGLGFCGLLGLYFLVYLILHDFRFAGPRTAIFALPIGTAISGGLLWWWIVRRGWLTRKPASMHWAIVAAAFVASLVCPAVFTAFIK